MDYGKGHPYGNGEPKKLSLQKFSEVMHSRYAAQWAVESFQSAVLADNVKVHAIWDDHDFAWNNSRGGEPGGDDENFVSPPVRRLSRALFQQFRDSLSSKPRTYPANPYKDGKVEADLGGIQCKVDLMPNVRLILTDGRSFRRFAHWHSSILGEDQKKWLEGLLLPEPGINLIASGRPVKDGWRPYSDRRWLLDLARNHRILVLSGDAHKPSFWQRHGLLDATASAMAQPEILVSFKTGVFGQLEVTGSKITVGLWKGVQELERKVISRDHWAM